jgi:glycosyltransferase involved in cell wall biosynthesis
MKKDILFIMNNLHCGGAEKALISLLQKIDYNHYNVDLLLFKQEGIFLNKLPSNVQLLKQPIEYSYFDMPLKNAIKENLKEGRVGLAISRIKAGFVFKFEKNRARCEQRTWRYISNSLVELNKKYDIAIGFLEKNPIYFCVDKVKADKKIGFIHTDYDHLGMDETLDIHYFEKLDSLITVSDSCAQVLKKRFPMFTEKIRVLKNIVSSQLIKHLAVDDYSPKLNENSLKIVSVGRLHYTKGFDMAVEACNRLLGKGYDIYWYIVGEGEERKNLERLIQNNSLENRFMLVGLKENPYPYIKNADIYVQTSLFEGNCITVTEAKILNKPIVSTNFDAIYEQLVHGRNGLIVDKDPDSICRGIVTLINNPQLRKKLTKHLSTEKTGEDEIQTFYKYIS